MRCPFCTHPESSVRDSRPAEDNAAIRRRRECPECGQRFTTFERVQLRDITVSKSGGRKQPFDRDKITKSMQIALRKRPVELEGVEKVVSGIVRKLESRGDSEVSSDEIGEYAMQALAKLDIVGYIRYASVYKDFREPDDFDEFLDQVKQLKA